MINWKEPGEVKKAYNTFFNDTMQVKLRSRWKGDFELYRMKPYDAGRGYYSYTHNYPRVYADKALSIITQSRLLVRLPMEILKAEERKQAGENERLIYGCHILNDERLRKKGAPNLRAQMAWHVCLRGGFLLLSYVYKNENGETVPMTEVYDMYNSAWSIGKDGVEWAIFTRNISKGEAKDRYGIETGASEVTVYSVWTGEEYGVVVGDKFVNEEGEMAPHGLDYCPVGVFYAGEMPETRHQGYNYTNVHRGESIFHSMRTVAPAIDKTMSDLLTLVRRAVKPPIGVWSAGAERTVEADIYQVTKGGVTQLDSAANEDVRPLITPSMPVDFIPLIQHMNTEEQHAGFPYTVFGELGFRLSGFAINQLQASIMTVVAPYIDAIESAYEWDSREKLKQFGSGKFPAVKVRGRTSKNEPFGYPEARKIKYKDIKEDWFPEVTLVPVLPKDDAQRYLLARTAREDQGQGPLLSDQTILDDVIGVEDPELEDEKKAREWAARRPINQLYRAFTAALMDGRPDIARNVLAELQMMVQGVEQGAPTGAGQGAPSGLEEEAMEAPGTGVPSGETGAPSLAAPSEMQGGMPGGARMARGR